MSLSRWPHRSPLPQQATGPSCCIQAFIEHLGISVQTRGEYATNCPDLVRLLTWCSDSRRRISASNICITACQRDNCLDIKIEMWKKDLKTVVTAYSCHITNVLSLPCESEKWGMPFSNKPHWISQHSCKELYFIWTSTMAWRSVTSWRMQTILGESVH
jgi:hypothetical protein